MITSIKTVDLFKMLSDENRLRIIHLLTQKELCVCHMAEVLGISQTNLSHHLSKLYSANMVCYRKDGQWIYYRINNNFVNDNRQLFEYLKDVFLSDDVYKDDLTMLHSTNDSHCNK